jgi:cation:H+ antiporter
MLEIWRLERNFKTVLVFFLLGLGLVLLLTGGKLLVDGATAIAVKLNMSHGLIGLTVVALGTSAPELLVSIKSAISGNSDLAIGNVIGSNIANIGLVLGISGLIYPILLRKEHLKSEYTLLLAVTLLLYLLSLDQEISFWEGLLLFGCLLLLLAYLVKNGQKTPASENLLLEANLTTLKKINWSSSLALVLGGMTALYFGAELLINNAVSISEDFGISKRVIGAGFIALGTSLPELTTSIIAALSKRTDLAFGNILGSNLINILLILGTTAMIKPIRVAEAFLSSDYLWMIGITCLLFPLMRTKMRISKIEGAILFSTYLLYLYFLL